MYHYLKDLILSNETLHWSLRKRSIIMLTLPGSKCIRLPYDSMHGTMTYRPSMQFHAWNHIIHTVTSNFRSTCVSLSGNNWKTTGFDLI